MEAKVDETDVEVEPEAGGDSDSEVEDVDEDEDEFKLDEVRERTSVILARLVWQVGQRLPHPRKRDRVGF
jgi:hypothetical protein